MRLLPVYPKSFVGGEDNPLQWDISFYRHEDKVVTEVTLTEKHAGYPGFVHGGVIAALLDEVMGRIVSSILKKLVMTGKMSIRYRAPLPIGTTIKAEGELEENQEFRKISWKARARLFDQKGNTYASAQASFFPIPEEKYQQVLSSLKIKGQSEGITLDDI